MKKLLSKLKKFKLPGPRAGKVIRKPFSLGNTLARVVLLLVIASTAAIAYIKLVTKSAGWTVYSIPTLREGDISPRQEIAPFDFVVPKPARVLEQERLNAEYSALPVYTFDPGVQPLVNAELDSLFALVRDHLNPAYHDTAQIRPVRLFEVLEYTYIDSLAAIVKRSFGGKQYRLYRTFKTTINNNFSQLIVSSKSDMYSYTDELFRLEEGDASRRVNVDETVGVDEAAKTAIEDIAQEYGKTLNTKALATLETVLKRMIRPNVWYNRERSMAVRREARDAVPANWAVFKKNQRIIDAYVPVTALHIEAIETLKKEISRRSFIENPREHYLIALGKILIALGIIGIFVAYLYLYRWATFNSFSKLLLLSVISFFPLSIAFYAAWSGSLSEFLIPVAIASILTTILFDAELGIMVSIIVSLLVESMVPGTSLRIGVIYFLAGGVGSVTVGKVRHRKEFYRSMFFLPVTMALAVASTNDWLTHPGFRDVGNDLFLAAMNGFFCPIIAIGLLPLLESVFKVPTDITLLELSDMNNPLLKDLAVKAPGTFSSVLVVGTLAEASAERIGANALLARVGGYYHDIGKMVIPEYFIENLMSGENPHDRLSPHMSALIISSHVKEGYELGVKYGLPEAILDIIQQHHGTSLMASIYHKAITESEDKKVDEAAFRYPGPKPQTREAAIVMLADLVEATSRSVQERSPGRLITLIKTIIQKRYMEGELDECDLTLRDLHEIEQSFLPVLVGSHHGRIEYPWQKEQKEKGGG